MIGWILLIAAGLLIALIAYGSFRLALPRKAGFEGIETPETAAAYSRFNRWPQFGLIRSLVLNKLSGYQPEGTIVDIGCGPGLLTIRLARRFTGQSIIGVDTAEEMIINAGRNIKALGIEDRVAFKKGDVTNLPFEDNSIGFAVSTLSFHHWENPGNGLKEIHRVLQPGGQLLIFDIRRDARRGFLWLLKFVRTIVVPRAIREVNEPVGSLFASYTIDELENFIFQSPFPTPGIDGGTGFYFLYAQKAEEPR